MKPHENLPKFEPMWTDLTNCSYVEFSGFLPCIYSKSKANPAKNLFLSYFTFLYVAPKNNKNSSNSNSNYRYYFLYYCIFFIIIKPQNSNSITYTRWNHKCKITIELWM